MTSAVSLTMVSTDPVDEAGESALTSGRKSKSELDSDGRGGASLTRDWYVLGEDVSTGSAPLTRGSGK